MRKLTIHFHLYLILFNVVNSNLRFAPKYHLFRSHNVALQQRIFLLCCHSYKRSIVVRHSADSQEQKLKRCNFVRHRKYDSINITLRMMVEKQAYVTEHYPFIPASFD